MQPVTLEAILPHLWISGRSSRAEWWRVHIICAVLVTVFDHMFIARLEQGLRGDDTGWVSLLWAIVSLAFAWVSFASVVRRMHDRGKSGWWALLYFVPGIGWLWLLVECGFLPGKPAPAPRMPAFTPTPARTRAPTPASASRTAARLQAAPRVGTVQRVESRPWNDKRTLKLAGNATRFVLAAAAAFILYKMVLDPSSQAIFTDLNTTFSE